MDKSKLARNNSLHDMVPNNSDKAREGARSTALSKSEPKKQPERQKLKPVVKKGAAVVQKKSVFGKMKDAFLGESGNLGDYLMYDVLIPSFRDTLSDMGIGIIERMFGTGRGRTSRSNIVRDRGRSYVSYNSNSNNRRDNGRDIDRNARARHDFNNIVFTNKWEAEDVLSNLVDMVAEYDEATVSEFYELSGIQPDYTDDKFGWTNLRDAYVERVRNGYVIVFPRTKPL